MTSNPRRTNSWRRNQLRARVLKAYDTCHLCGQPVDKTLGPGDDWSPEVDELVPVSRGGNPLSWHNVALSHRTCNRQRGNTPLDQLPPTPNTPTTSRDW